MDINELISIIKKKLLNQLDIESIYIEDKSFLHKKHPGNQIGKFHLKITCRSQELKKMSKVDSNKRIYKVLEKEIEKYIHSFQIRII